MVLAIASVAAVTCSALVFKLTEKPTALVPLPPMRPQFGRSDDASPTGFTSYSANPRLCLVDANGDGTSDVVGFASAVGTPDELVLLDGKNGEPLWRGGKRTAQSQLVCLGPEWFVLVLPNFQAEFMHARNLGAAVRVLLRDQLSAYGTSSGCVRLRTSDGTVQGVALPSGLAVDCPAKLTPIYGEMDSIIGLTDKSTALHVGDKRYELEKRRSGTAMLTLTVVDKDKTVWSRELPYAAPTFSTGISVADDVIALWVSEPGQQQRGILVGLDEGSGEQRYAVPSKLLVSNNVRYFGFNGRYVLVQVWTSLLAFEPKSGALAWHIGPS